MLDPMHGPLQRLGSLLVALAIVLLSAPAGAQEGGWFDDTGGEVVDNLPDDADTADADTDDEVAARSDVAESTPSRGPEAGGYADTDPRALTDFRPALDPYGEWVEDPTYGLVWIPHRHVVGEDFAPYVTSGHWALTADGDWLWVSDYPFGWVVFHYGRWVWVPDVGWAWIPGREYSNAWVVWRVPTGSYAYVGWAPAPPSYVWVDGVVLWLWFTPPAPYVFCPSAYAFHHHVHYYVVHDHRHVHRIARHSRRYRSPGGRVPRHGPSMSHARVPARAVPKQRTAADPRAVRASERRAHDRRAASVPRGRTLKRPGAPSARAMAKQRGTRSLGSTPAARPSGSRTARPAPRAGGSPRAVPRGSAPRARPAPRASGSRSVRPAPRAAPSRGAPRAAPSRAAPRARPAPRSTQPGPTYRSRPAPLPSHSRPTVRPSPARSAPSYPRYSPPRAGSSAPSRAAPPPKRSAPSRSRGRGGARGRRP